jgi:hypothetical protein
MGTLFVDYENGNDNFAGSSFAPLASGTDGVISSVVSPYAIFSSASANFPNDNSIAPTKNEAWYSEHLQVYGSVANSTIVRDSSVNPPSGISGYVFKITENTSTSTHGYSSITNYTPIYAGTQYTVSIYAKANGRNKILLRYDADARSALFNLADGTITSTGASATSSITSVGDGWYRLSLTITTPAGSGYSAENWQIFMAEDSFNSTSYLSSSYIGNGSSGVYLSAMQIEPGSSATSYEIPAYQLLSIFTGSTYTTFHITERVSSTSLRINLMNASTSPTTQSARQYYIGGRVKTISSTGLTSARTIPGDTIRVMGSPAPTLVGSGLWTSHKGGFASNVSSTTNTSPITVNTSSTMSVLGVSTGDTITIAGHTTNTNANGTWVVTVANPALAQCTLNGSTGNGVGGASGFFRKRTNCVVTLNSAVTANIASYGNRGEGRTAWTASANVTATLDGTDTREGDASDSIAIGAAFTTGKAAYKATGTLNLSNYQQISFFIKQTAGTVSVAGDISLRLCSDTTGDTTVHTFNIEGLVALNSWVPITIDLGTNMNSSIQSIALYIDADKGAQTFLLSNIIACKASSAADSLTLTSLIGKNTTNEPWFTIMSINGTRVVLGAYPSSTPLTNASSSTDTYRGYYGFSGTGTFDVYKRETIKTVMAAAVTTTVQEIQEAGISGSPTNYEFGWDRTNMSTQNLETIFDGRNGNGYGLYNNSKNYVNLNKIGCVRYYEGVRLITSYSTVTNCYGIGCNNNGISIVNGGFNTFNNLYTVGNNYGYFLTGMGSNVFTNIISHGDFIAGMYPNNATCNNTLSNLTFYNVGRTAIDNRDSTDNVFSSGIIEGCNTNGITVTTSHNSLIKNFTISNSSLASVSMAGGEIFLENCILNDSTEFSHSVLPFNGQIYCTNHDNTSGNTFISTQYGTIRPQTSVRYSNSGYAWAMAPTNSIRDVSYPLRFSIAKIAVNANYPVSIKAWMRRTNTLLTTGLRIKGGQIAGVSNDITSYMSAAADTWQQVTLSFTPTEVGVVEILAECYGGSTYTAYVDDLSITQV